MLQGKLQQVSITPTHSLLFFVPHMQDSMIEILIKKTFAILHVLVQMLVNMKCATDDNTARITDLFH